MTLGFAQGSFYHIYVRFDRGHVGPDDGYEDFWVSHIIVVHDRGLEMLS